MIQEPGIPLSSCFQILLVPLSGPDGERGSSGSSKETVFRVFFPLLLLQGGSVEDVLVEPTSSSSIDSKEVSPVSTVCYYANASATIIMLTCYLAGVMVTMFDHRSCSVFKHANIS